MEHKEYKRMNEQSETAVLFIHGIVGTPNHFNEFLSLVPDTFSVYNLLLDGHGKGARDFAHTRMRKWEMQVKNAVDELSSTHQKIYIVAHSMGTLFSIEQAIQNPKVSKLYLLAVPIKLFIKPRMIINSLKVYFDKINPDDPIALAAQKSYGIAHEPNPLHYIGWIPRFLELFRKIADTRKILPLLKTPCIAYQSTGDEMVAFSSVKCLKQNPCVSVVELKKSGHYYYHQSDYEFLLTEFKKFVEDTVSEA